MRRVIHVHQQRIRANIKAAPGEELAPIIVRTYKGPHYANTARTTGPVEFIYNPRRPLSCGARLYAVTDSEVVLDPGTADERRI